VEVTPPVYLFGTLHLPYNSVWDTIPENVKRAFSSSRDVLLELQLSSSETTRHLVECQMLPNDQDIAEILHPELVKRVDNYLRRIRTRLPNWLSESSRSTLIRGGVSLSEKFFRDVTYNWRRKRPVWILSLISTLTEENVESWDTPVLDHFMDNAARRLGKNLTALETVNDHCQPLKKLGDVEVETALRVQLDYLESLLNGPPPTMQRNLAAYRCGDLGALVDSQPFLPLAPFSELTSAINVTESDLATLQGAETMLYNKLATRRNRRMTKTIESLLTCQRNHSIFIAIGAAHLIGAKSVVERLEKRGYVVHHVGTSETIEGPNLPGNIVALGDPGSVPQTSSILTLPPEERGGGDVRQVTSFPLGRLSSDELQELMDYFFGRAQGSRRRRAANYSRSHVR
jgi:uncharacterized protein YbaP (TraB family)